MVKSNMKRKKVSKKNKLSWRKHTKIESIEEFLNEQREEERLGGPFQSVSDDQLFLLDSEPTKPQISRKIRKLRATRPLKGFSVLQPPINVLNPIKKRNMVRTSEERKSDFVKNKTLEKQQKRIFKVKKNARAKERSYEMKQDREQSRGEFNADIWSEEKCHAVQKDSWLEPVTKVHILRNKGISMKKKVNCRIDKKSPLPAVEVPHPGTSYNPSFKDHQDLLKVVAAEEVEIIKKEEHLNRVTRSMFRKVTEFQKEAEWMVEMSEGISSKTISDENEPKVELQTQDLDVVSVNAAVQNKKKTLKQRRKQREQMELQKQKKAQKIEKKKIGDIHNINALKHKLEKIEKKQNKLREIRKVRAVEDKMKPKMLSSTTFVELRPDFQLGQDIAGNLRAFKKEGNLLTDRFKSLQKRNILEPSKRTHKKYAKIKKYTRSGHKDDWEQTVARISIIKNGRK